MVKTSWPYVEWAETVGKKGVEKLHVVEEIVIGEDAEKLGSGIRKVAIFSTHFRPSALSANGSKLVGIVAESMKREYVYSVFFERVKDGEVKKFEVNIEGKSTKSIMQKDGYWSNFAWNDRHIQMIVFPKGTAILSASPKGYQTETYRSKPCVVWRRNGKYQGDVRVKTFSPVNE